MSTLQTISGSALVQLGTNEGCIPCGKEEQWDDEFKIRAFWDQASETLRAHTNVLVPECLGINRMPFEVISYIFALSLPRRFGAYSDFESAPLILGAVCRMWRDIAWSTPQLWNRIKIHLTPRSPAKGRYCLRMDQPIESTPTVNLYLSPQPIFYPILRRCNLSYQRMFQSFILPGPQWV